MRITFVSAHYPPNFVSGGTLQPQRLARGLPRPGPRRPRVRRLPRQHAPPAGDVGRGRRAPACPCAGSCPRRGSAGPTSATTTTPGGRARSRPTSQRAPRRRRAPPRAADPRRRPGGGGQGVGRGDGRHDARLLVGRAPASSWSTATTGRAASWSRPATAPARTGGRTSSDEPRGLREALRRRRPRAGALAIGGRRCSRANGVDAATARGRRERDGRCRRPGPAAPPAPADGQPGRRALHRREQPDEGGRRAPRGRPPARRRARAADHRPRPRRRRGRDGRSLDGHRRSSWCPPTRPSELDDVLAATDVLVLPSVMRESHSLVTREALLRRRAGDLHRHPRSRGGGRRRRERPRRPGRRRRAAGRRARASLADPSVLGTPADGAPPPRPRCARSTTRSPGSRRATRALVRRASAAPSADERRRGCCSWWASTARRCATGPTCPPRPSPSTASHSDVRHYRDPDVARPGGPSRRRGRLPRARHPPGARADRPSARARARPVVFDVDDLIFDPGIADEIPALRLLPPDEAALWLEGVHALPHHDGGLRRLHRFDPAAGRARPRGGGHRRAPVRERRRRRASAWPATSRSAGRAGPARSGSATSAAPPPTTTTGGTSSAAVVEVLEAHPDAELWLGGHLQPDRGGHRPRSAIGSVGCRSPPGTGCRRCCATSTSTWRRSSRAAASTTPRAPSSGWRPPSSATPTIASPSAPFRDAIERRAHRVARRRPGRVGHALDARPPGRRPPRRWSAPGLGARRCCAGHRTARATATCRSWPRCAPTRATVRPPVSAAAAAFDEPPLPAPTRLEAYPVPIEGSIGWRVRRIPRPTLLRRLRTKVGAVRRSVVDDGAAATLGRGGPGRPAGRRATGRDG